MRVDGVRIAEEVGVDLLNPGGGESECFSEVADPRLLPGR